MNFIWLSSISALIIAGKLFGFHIEMKQIIKLVRMSKTTVFKRLTEFSKTATSKLTTDEFNKVDLEEEADPPSYTEGRNRAKFAQEYGKKVDFVSPDVISQVAKTQEQLEVLLEKRKSINKSIQKTEEESSDFNVKKQLPADYQVYANAYDIVLKKENKVEQTDEISENVIEEPEEEVCKAETSSTSQLPEKTVASSTLLLDDALRQAKEDSLKKAKETEEGSNDTSKLHSTVK